jgi:hypothetical protein
MFLKYFCSKTIILQLILMKFLEFPEYHFLIVYGD